MSFLHLFGGFPNPWQLQVQVGIECWQQKQEFHGNLFLQFESTSQLLALHCASQFGKLHGTWCQIPVCIV